MLLCKVLQGSASEVGAILAGKWGVKHTGAELDAMSEVAKSAKNRWVVSVGHWWITVSIFFGTPKRASTTNISPRSTVSYASWRSMKTHVRGCFTVSSEILKLAHDKQQVDRV